MYLNRPISLVGENGNMESPTILHWGLQREQLEGL